ncbi:hypothetical protein RFI_29916 [Reticulomyxa filosa]|uniref:XK-related protein n=1 Tax=Reticulomyxa filosa TaxID=46433 RepID=X6M246_RETFI|nr:hypothetical protein RFI_29916 [Reticulomyxa filosa]|eukprot:ETO07477.1 hypothetical protein RFI_29916 [Reticulomyxa filosa]
MDSEIRDDTTNSQGQKRQVDIIIADDNGIESIWKWICQEALPCIQYISEKSHKKSAFQTPRQSLKGGLSRAAKLSLMHLDAEQSKERIKTLLDVFGRDIKLSDQNTLITYASEINEELQLFIEDEFGFAKKETSSHRTKISRVKSQVRFADTEQIAAVVSESVRETIVSPSVSQEVPEVKELEISKPPESLKVQIAKKLDQNQLELIKISHDRHNSGNVVFPLSDLEKQPLNDPPTEDESKVPPINYLKRLSLPSLRQSTDETHLAVMLNSDNDNEEINEPVKIHNEHAKPLTNEEKTTDSNDNKTIQWLNNPSNFIDIVYTAFVELLSLFDLITDILVLTMFISIQKQLWTSLMLLSMIAPYLVAYTAFGSLIQHSKLYNYGYQNEDIDSLRWRRRNQNNGWFKTVMQAAFTIGLLTPLSIVYFALIDVLFIFLETFSLFVNIFCCGKFAPRLKKMNSFIFREFLGLTHMQVVGYRRYAIMTIHICRTLSQLLFESIPQLILQMQVLYYTKSHHFHKESVKKKLSNEFNETYLILSVFFAVIHITVELWTLSIEGTKKK